MFFISLKSSRIVLRSRQYLQNNIFTYKSKIIISKNEPETPDPKFFQPNFRLKLGTSAPSPRRVRQGGGGNNQMLDSDWSILYKNL